MKNRIFKYMVCLVLASVFLVGTIAIIFSYKIYKDNAQNDIKQAANLIDNLKGDYTTEQINDILVSSHSYKIRLTEIDLTGKVLYDSYHETDSMENHLDRDEVKEAIEFGFGEDVRYSETIGSNTYYYAIDFNGNIIRLSREISSIFHIFVSILPILIVPTIIIIIVSVILSSKLSVSIVNPVSEMVQELNIFTQSSPPPKSFKHESYSEFAPIEREIRHMSNEIQRYILKLKTQKEKIHLITENMVEGMILLDERRDILSVNKSAIKILNENFDKKTSTNFLQLTRNRKLINSLDELKSKDNINTIISEEKGKVLRHYRVLGNRVITHGEIGFILFIIDITESHQAAEIRRDFASNITHELKTPLTTIKGFGEMMSDGIINQSDDMKKYGAIILRESERLLSLINDTIRLSEIEEVSLSATRTQIYLPDLIDDVVKSLKTPALNRNITIENCCDDIYIKGNKSYLSEMLFNLTDNAIKYNVDNGKVYICGKSDDTNIIITVRDTGIGISPQYHSRIFERFFRVDKSRSKRTGGTGLGLSIVKHTAISHGGYVEIDSEVNKGTTITVYIPK